MMAKRTRPTEMEVTAAAGRIRTIRMLLEAVPMEMLEYAFKGVGAQMVMMPFLDPTKYLREDKARDFDVDVQKSAARKLIELKKIWRQDVQVSERVQEELDRRAPL